MNQIVLKKEEKKKLDNKIVSYKKIYNLLKKKYSKESIEFKLNEKKDELAALMEIR